VNGLDDGCSYSRLSGATKSSRAKRRNRTSSIIVCRWLGSRR
jgi:hypothetical protein